MSEQNDRIFAIGVPSTVYFRPYAYVTHLTNLDANTELALKAHLNAWIKMQGDALPVAIGLNAEEFKGMSPTDKLSQIELAKMDRFVSWLVAKHGYTVFYSNNSIVNDTLGMLRDWVKAQIDGGMTLQATLQRVLLSSDPADIQLDFRAQVPGGAWEGYTISFTCDTRGEILYCAPDDPDWESDDSAYSNFHMFFGTHATWEKKDMEALLSEIYRVGLDAMNERLKSGDGEKPTLTLHNVED